VCVTILGERMEHLDFSLLILFRGIDSIMMLAIMDTMAVRSQTKPTRLQIGLWALIMVALLAFSLYDWGGYQVGTYGDDASYITNADSLLQHVPYGMLLKPNEDEPTQFPFVLPLLLAPIRALFPTSLDALRVIPLVATLLAMSVLFWGWRLIGKGLSFWWGLVTVALTALSPLTILHARTVMSEAPFLFFCLLLIWWIERVVEEPPRRWGIVFGLLLLGVVYTRTIGWAMVPFWLAYLLWKLRRAAFAQFGVAVLAMASALLVVVNTTTVTATDLLPQEYLQQWNTTLNSYQLPAPLTNQANSAPANSAPPSESPLATMTRVMLVHLDFAEKLPFALETAVIDWTNRYHVSFLRYVPGIVLIALVLMGAVKWLRLSGITALQIMAPPYLTVILLWRFSGPRLFYPIQLHLFLASVLGLGALVEFAAARVNPRAHARQWAWGAVTVAVLGISVIWMWLDLRFQSVMLLPSDQTARAALLRQYIPPGAIVLSTRATTDHLYLDRTLIDIPFRAENAPQLVAYLQRQHIDYIVTHAGIRANDVNEHLRTSAVRRFVRALAPLLETNVLEEKYLDNTSDVAIYRVRAEILNTLHYENAP
jgi:hypothetical protein